MATTNIYEMVDTWNDGAVVFTAIGMNVTDTASDADSLLLDLQVGGVSQFSVKKDGTTLVGDGTSTDPSIAFLSNTGLGLYRIGADELGIAATKVGIGTGATSPDGLLHVMTASAGSVTASADGDELVVEGSGDGGISILSPDASFGQIYFGSPSDSIGAFMRWKYTSNRIQIGTASAGGGITLMTANAAEAVRIDASQRVIVGHTTGINAGSVASQLQIHGVSSGTMTLTRWDSSNGGPVLVLGKARGGVVGTASIASNNDQLGNIRFVASDGTDLNTVGALIRADVNGTPAANRIPTDLLFYTAAGAVDNDLAVGMTLTKDKKLNVVAGLGVYGVAAPAQAAHIVDADGTLADITTKFNTLLTVIEGVGFTATS